MSQSTDWHSSHRGAYSEVGQVAFTGTIFILVFLNTLPIQVIILFLLVLYGGALAIIYTFYQDKRHSIEKLFWFDYRDTGEIVTSILATKQLPYQKRWHNGRHEYALTDSEIVIAVSEKEFSGYRRRMFSSYSGSTPIASLVTIRPTTAENLPLIQSLQGKLDQAFTPAGLQANADTLAIKFRTETNAKQK